MEQPDSLIERYRSLAPRRFSYGEHFDLFPESSEGSGMSLTLRIELLSDTLEKQNLRLLFYGVKDLQVHIALDYIEFEDLQIVSIRDSQWENLKYEVRSGGANKLSFFCQHFAAELVMDEVEEKGSDLEERRDLN